MYHYTFLISEVWSQESGIGMKGLSSIISGRNCHPGFWISWPPILQYLMDFILELYTSNRFSSAKSCAALVGDSRTPSFPSFVHIPSLNSHQSLLSSRDEIFKEIQDVGEDDSVSSLHLFFWNMDLPPSSYHDSLEELWNEEEEPEEVETVMKVVPYVYHQYLDVFSNVKAGKVPPHCACDHHIELEGSLPSVGVTTLYQAKSQIHSGPTFQRM
ncbi:hypothetical protein O181_108247 [Austropuccinia psidii MF-1]|uniref:Uncharacterized protein n=1 Tax=Austropuccinia psidii MF-1 TaxID=1389203 RepID=A0A9Q3JVJ3_9BASI|nr:hypothetical protein [Austropuccinia psidii MF-1]